MNSFSRLIAVFVLASFSLALAPLTSDATANDNRPKLSIGSKAPKIDIEHWMSMPEGFEEVKRFKKGNVYVVEFWATWCGPCLRAMPHIAEVAEKYSDQGVQVIGVSSEKLDKVKAFLSKNPKNDKTQTWADITSKYCLTCDPDGSVRKDIFRAAGQTGIPCAMIIGKTGHVEWIGYPPRIDKPLEQIVAGTWDRSAFKVSFEKAWRVKRNKKEVASLLKTNKHNSAVTQIAKLIKDSDGDERRKFQLQSLEICLKNNLKRTEKDFKKIAKEYFKNSTMMNSMAWAVVSAHQDGAEIDPDVLELARTASDLAVKGERSASSLDTLAHIADMQGNIDEAIKIQTEAIEKADDKLKPKLEEYLEELQGR